MTTGLERRDEGWSAVQAADAAVNRGYGKVIRRALDQCIQLGEPFTSDDVDKIARTAARAGRIQRTGNRRRSTHPSRNAAYNAEWKAS